MMTNIFQNGHRKVVLTLNRFILLLSNKFVDHWAKSSSSLLITKVTGGL